MSLSVIPQSGTIAGWKLELAPMLPVPPVGMPKRRGAVTTLSSRDYRGSVEASMVSGLEGGSYTVVVEGVATDDLQKLTKLVHGNDPIEARLYLYWEAALIPSPDADGLVAILRVTALRRRPGKWRYEMVVEGREWVYDRMMQPCPVVTGVAALGAAVEIARALLVDLDPAPDPVVSDEKRTTNGKVRAIEEMRELEKAMVAAAAAKKPPRAGLGMYLIRDGKLRIGPDRLRVPKLESAIPLLDAGSGLLAIERNGVVDETNAAVGIDGGRSPRRDCFIATLRGRPDLKPGDIVRFATPETGDEPELEFALGPAAQFAGNTTVTAYVQSVSHRLSREQGFITALRCVAAQSGNGDLLERLWFDGAATDTAAAGGTGESFLTRVFERVRDAARTDRWPDVAQVRAHRLGGDSGPAQTEQLWRGLAPDGLAYAAARAGFAATKKELAAAPYATPFAYGKCGLVVPRYPGTRVLVVNRGGDPDDPVDVGALWTRGQGPDGAEIGDWWLILPVDLEGDQAPRAAIPDDDTAEQRASRATQDLIDARGNRVIEVGALTVRIGKDSLRAAGERPPVANDPVTIEHAAGNARIVIAQDGSITIETAKTLTLKGEEGISLQTGNDVKVTVGGHFDVVKGS